MHILLNLIGKAFYFFELKMEPLPPEMIQYYLAEHNKNRGRVWNRDEEMRKVEEEEMFIEQTPDGRHYRINLLNSRGIVDYCTMDYIRHLIYNINLLKYHQEQDGYEMEDYINKKDAALREVNKLKSICMDLYNRIPPELRPPPPF